MNVNEFETTVPSSVLSAYRWMAAYSNTTLEQWVDFCCTSKLSGDLAASLQYREKRKRVVSKSPRSLARIKSAGKPAKLKIEVRADLMAAWEQQAQRESLSLGQWILRSCDSFLAEPLREILRDLIGPASLDRREILAAKLFRLYHWFGPRYPPKCPRDDSDTLLLIELGIPRIGLANHTPELPNELMVEREQMVDRMLELCSVDDMKPYDIQLVPGPADLSHHPNREIDELIRFYFTFGQRMRLETEQDKEDHRRQQERIRKRLSKRHPSIPVPDFEAEPSISEGFKNLTCRLELLSAMPISLEQRLERRRVFPIVHRLYELVVAGATKQQLLQSLDPGCPFGRYALSKLESWDDEGLGDAVSYLSASAYLRRIQDEQWEAAKELAVAGSTAH